MTAEPKPEASELVTDPRIDLLFLSEPEMIEAGVTDVAACIDVMADTLRLYSLGDTRMGGRGSDSHGLMMSFPDESPFPGMPLNGPDRRFMALPAYVGGEYRMTGVKWYGSNVENRDKGLPRSVHTMVLNNPDTGAPTAVMAGNLVSAYRTAAVPGAAARIYAADNAETIAIIGPGVMNTTALESFLSIRPSLKRVRILGRSPERTRSFAEYVESTFPQLEDIVLARSLEDAVKGADIISVAVTSKRGIPNYPFIHEGWIKPGAFISLPAAGRFDDDFLLKRAYTLVDSTAMFTNMGADFERPVHNGISLAGFQLLDLVLDGRMSWDDVVQIGDVFAGKTSAEKPSEQITIFAFGGMPIEDVAWSTHVYRNAMERGIGTALNYWTQPHLV